MNIFDISRLAGVSRKTVQRVLNNATNVKPETQEKIRRVMEEHHYEPSAVARKLSSSKPTTVAIFIVQDAKQYKLYTDDLYYGAVIGGIISYCNTRAYNTLVSIMDVTDPDQLLSLFKQKTVDAGVIISWCNVEAIVDKATKAGFPIAVFDQNNADPLDGLVPIPRLDDWTSAYKAATHLLDLGHTRLGIVTGDMNIPCAPVRLAGFVKAVEDRGLRVSPHHIHHGHFVEQSGAEAIDRWLADDRLPEALFCSNDLMAYGALKALIRQGISVPEQMSLIGFDDLLISEYMHPPLTTMRVPRIEMAIDMTERLIDRLENPSERSVSFSPAVFQAELVERASTFARSDDRR
ncbi:LacI family DNA-binding transcriptional regulator [Cohnella yongneupensis]|uniref:LacI family DNA-binding transcriptional regulator n=1 Tax=Cohnella yongneupensis TaxID=425006 RepID=A0ABW0QVW2_9BACL